MTARYTRGTPPWEKIPPMPKRTSWHTIHCNHTIFVLVREKNFAKSSCRFDGSLHANVHDHVIGTVGVFLARTVAASVRQRIAFGERAGEKVVSRIDRAHAGGIIIRRAYSRPKKTRPADTEGSATLGRDVFWDGEAGKLRRAQTHEQPCIGTLTCR